MSLLHRVAVALALALLALPALAVSEQDLLPVDQAFRLRAEAVSRNRIDLHWQIAPGYYLYRERIGGGEIQGFKQNPWQLPEGQKKHDEFFGDVQIYRGKVTARITGAAADDLDSVTLEVRYQGCADAGVCYPPQKRRLQVSLPRGSGVAAALSAPATPLRLPGAGPSALPGVQSLPLPAEQAFGFEAIAQDGNTVLLRFTPAPGYYLYRDRTTLSASGAAGLRTAAPRWPAGQSYRDEHFGDVVVYFDQTEVPLPLLREHAEPVEITLAATFQGCQRDGICYPPMTRRVNVALPAGRVSPRDQASAVPLPIQPLSSAPLPAAEPVAPSAATPTTNPGQPPRQQPPASEHGLLAALLLALLGGLVLNLMPCVLPILSLKVLGLAHSGESRSRARAHALCYTLGVLVSFAVVGALVIGLRAAGQAAGWGFQLQQPWFVAALVYLLFAVGLSLTGVFTLGSNFGGLGQSLTRRPGPLGDFFTGVLACVVASPCIAPFMGSALAYAFTAPALVALLVFLALGVGLALPFLLIGLIPSLARRLPAPGAWMETLKQGLAFPMYLSAIWMLWVLGKQRGVDAIALVLVGIAALALGLGWFERSRWNSHRRGQWFSLLLLALALLPVWGVTRLPVSPAALDSGQVAYSAQLLDRLRAGDRVVFVNISADWCVTCKANERGVLGSAAFRDLLRRTDAVYMSGDWTNVDPAISAFLEQHHAVGVPLYVIYGPGAPPRVLPTVLTEAVVEDALLRAAR